LFAKSEQGALQGSGPNTGRAVLRGGSWNNNGQNLRSANRNRNNRDNRNNNRGFRVARPPGRLGATGHDPEFSSLKGTKSVVRVTMSPVPESGRWAGSNSTTATPAR